MAERATGHFLDGGWRELHLDALDARAKFTDLARQSFDAFFLAKGLKSVEIASGRLVTQHYAQHLAGWCCDPRAFNNGGERRLPPRVTADDRSAHRAFVKTLGSEAVWLGYFTIGKVAA